MNLDELVSRLVAAGAAERAALLAPHASWAGVELAQALKAIYFDTYSSDPQRAAGAAAALAALASANDHPEIQALAAWTSGMAALQLEGQVERAIARIDDAAARFEALGQPHTAASTQVSKIFALARLGRYDEAIACGLRARDVFLASDDTLAAGKIDLNLGNIYHRRDQYSLAEQFYLTARARFTAIGDHKLLTYADNGLANVLSMQHDFRAAAQLYEQALARAGRSHSEQCTGWRLRAMERYLHGSTAGCRQRGPAPRGLPWPTAGRYCDPHHHDCRADGRAGAAPSRRGRRAEAIGLEIACYGLRWYFLIVCVPRFSFRPARRNEKRGT